LSQHLSQQTETRRPECNSQGNLSPARDGARQQQVSHIGTSNKQNKSNGPEQHHQYRLGLSNEVFGQGLNQCTNVAVHFRILPSKPFRDRIRFRLGLLQSGISSQAADGINSFALAARTGTQTETDWGEDFTCPVELKMWR